MIPEGFRWIPRHQYDTQETALALGSVQVAFLLERNDGGWIARLAAHRGMAGPLVTRQCTSFDGGRAGVEAWVCRHEARLRAEVAGLPGG